MMDGAFFASDELIEREVTLGDGTKHTLHFKELPVTTFRKFAIAESSQDEDARAGAMAKLICESVCNPDGKLAMSYQKALTLKPGPARALMEVIYEINGVTGPNASPPREKSGSGTSSPSPLAEEASPSGSE